MGSRESVTSVARSFRERRAWCGGLAVLGATAKLAALGFGAVGPGDVRAGTPAKWPSRPIVLIVPWTDEAVPATWPSGSMASAPKLAEARPKQAMISPCMTMKVVSDSPPRASARCVAEKRVNRISPRWAMRRVPTRSTSREVR